MKGTSIRYCPTTLILSRSPPILSFMSANLRIDVRDANKNTDRCKKQREGAGRIRTYAGHMALPSRYMQTLNS